jgi:hypothetical protein
MIFMVHDTMIENAGSTGFRAPAGQAALAPDPMAALVRETGNGLVLDLGDVDLGRMSVQYGV